MNAARAVAAAIAATGLGGASQAIDFTYLEAGLLWENVDDSLGLPIGSVDAEAGTGVRVAGGVDFLLGVFVDGEVAWTTPEVDALLSVGDAMEAGTADATSAKYRLSGGYKMELFDILAAYGQAGYVFRSFDVDNLSLSGVANSLTLQGVDDDQSGFELEAGVRAEVLPRLELTGAVRYSDVAALSIDNPADISIPEQTTISGLEFDDGVFGEVGAIIDLAGPLAIRGTYEIGDTDSAFIGLRAQF